MMKQNAEKCCMLSNSPIHIVSGKVIIKKSRKEASPVEQDTIDCDYLAYLKFMYN